MQFPTVIGQFVYCLRPKPAAHGACFPAGLLAGLRACYHASSCTGSAASCVYWRHTVWVFVLVENQFCLEGRI